MTKAELVSKIASQKGYDKAVVLGVVESMMEEVKKSLARQENVYLRGFGSFITKTRAEKIARNISKGTALVVPEHQIPAFKPAKELMAAVK